MRPLYDDFDEFDFDDSEVVRRMLREQYREERRFAGKKHRGPSGRHKVEEYDEYDDIGDLEDYEDYDEYNDDEFDMYSGLDITR